MKAISVRNLSKYFDVEKKESKGFWSWFGGKKTRLYAVKDVSFDIESGDLVGFLGPNGAGKTTTLKMLSGILFPSEGDISIFGHRPWNRDFEFKMAISMVMGQKSQLWWDLPAMETFLLNKDIYEISDREFKKRLKDLTDILDVGDFIHTPVRQLSLGQRMKCEFIAALLHNPRLLFLDEPTIGLDVTAQESVRQFLKDYNREFKATIILTSHYMEDIQALCKKVIIINKGQKIYDGEFAGLTQDYIKEKIIMMDFEGEIPINFLSSLGKIDDVSGSRVTVIIPRETTSYFVSQVTGSFKVRDISIREPEAARVVADIFARSNNNETII